MPPSFLPLLCTFCRWKQCLLVTETWQIRGRVEEKPFIKKLELTTVFFCSVARRWVCSFSWLCVHFEVHVTCSCTQCLYENCGTRITVLVLRATVCCRQTCRHFLLASYVTLPLSSCQSVHVSILFLTFTHRLMLTTNMIVCHSITLLLGFGSSVNKITLLPS